MLSFPNAVSMERSEGGIETWLVSTDRGLETARLRTLLPIHEPLNGIAWCEAQWFDELQLQTASWADDTQWLVVSVGHYYPPKVEEPGPGSEVTISHEFSDEGC